MLNRRSFSTGAISALLASGLALAWATNAEASGFAVAKFGADHGEVTTDDPTAIYYNPAGLADRDPADAEKKFEGHIFLDGELAFRSVTWDHAASSTDVPEPMGAEGANTGHSSLFNVVFSPMIGANFKIKDFAVGAGFYVPFGGQASWDQNDKFKDSKQYAGLVDGVQRWHTISGTLRSLYISLGAAYDIADRVSIGASFNLVRSDIQTIRAREPGGTNDISVEGRSFLDVGGWEGAFGAGILGEIVPRKLWIGFSYQSEPGVIGDMKLKGTLQNNFGGTPTKDDVVLTQQLPAIYRFGLRARPAPKWEIRFSADVTDWSVFDNQCLTAAPPDGKEPVCDVNKDGSDKSAASAPAYEHPIQNLARRWGPAFGTRLGASYWIIDPVELFFGLGYDSNAIPDSTLEPTLVDFHNISPSLGGKFDLGKHFTAAISYTHFIFIPRDTTGKSVLADLKIPSKTPDSGGKFTQIIGLVDVNVEAKF